VSLEASNHKSGKQVNLPSLIELVPPERIAVDVEAADWYEATRIAGQLLLNSGAITPGYIDAMIQTAESLGQYIVIAPGIAMPHARPEDGARQTAMSLVRLKTPLNFGNPDHDPVKLVVALAAVDKQVHVRAMRTLALLLMAQGLVEQLMQAASPEEIYAVFEKAEAEDDA
jgi:mannitol/fructose-specific phosphotransferase system IIA component (Ntr-type)